MRTARAGASWLEVDALPSISRNAVSRCSPRALNDPSQALSEPLPAKCASTRLERSSWITSDGGPPIVHHRAAAVLQRHREVHRRREMDAVFGQAHVMQVQGLLGVELTLARHDPARRVGLRSRRCVALGPERHVVELVVAQ